MATPDTITITYTDNSTTPPTVITSAPFNISAAGMASLMQFGAADCYPQGVLVTPASGSTPAVYRAPTSQEIADAKCQQIGTAETSAAGKWLEAQQISAIQANPPVVD